MKTAIVSIKSNYAVQRFQRHLLLAVVAASIVCLVYFATPPPDFRHRFSMGTAYAALVFLAATLWLGPWHILRKRPNPVSFDLRRDLGIWAGVLAILHTAVGLTVHLRGRMWMYFFKHLHPLKVQNNQFGLANYTGLVAALLFLLLLVISNDVSLRKLGTRTWKSLQRWTYLAAALSILHGIVFQLIEKRRLAWLVFFYAVIAGVVLIQAIAFLQTKKKSSILRRSMRP